MVIADEVELSALLGNLTAFNLEMKAHLSLVRKSHIFQIPFKAFQA